MNSSAAHKRTDVDVAVHAAAALAIFMSVAYFGIHCVMNIAGAVKRFDVGALLAFVPVTLIYFAGRALVLWLCVFGVLTVINVAGLWFSRLWFHSLRLGRRGCP